jgi:hypothetical protein
VTDRLTPEDVAHCRLLAEIEVRLKVPYFVDVQDGWYHERIEVETEDFEVRSYGSSKSRTWTEVRHRRVPCDPVIPRYRTELRYRDAG